jgi:hypothetical protein
VVSKQIVEHKQAFLLLLRDGRGSLGAIPSKKKKKKRESKTFLDHVLLVNQLGASQMNS